MNFYSKLSKIHNTGSSRSIILHGNVHDIFYDGTQYCPLIPFLATKAKGPIHITYELNGPIRIDPQYYDKIREAWVRLITGVEDSYADALLRDIKNKKNTIKDAADKFDRKLLDCSGDSNTALELLRQFTICTRRYLNGNNLFIIIEAADMLLPCGNGDIAGLNDKQMHRISVMTDWLSDPAFVNGGDTLCMIAESPSQIHPRIARLPQITSVEIPAPNTEERINFIKSFNCFKEDEIEPIAINTAGLSLYALRQVIKLADGKALDEKEIIKQVEAYIQSQIGPDVVEFKRPKHNLDDCVGFTKVKNFVKSEMIPRFKTKKKSQVLTGAGVAGAIGGGKTHLFEAVAFEVDMPVLILKNFRSQWFGQTDVILERLYRILDALDRVLIFMDEADTQLGGLGKDVHETEKRATGKIQTWMSDSAWKGKVYWLLMTARIHLLSPDIRRPGRVGDLIIPVLDPEGEDRIAFIKWALQSVDEVVKIDETISKLDKEVLAVDYSAASFSSLKSNVEYHVDNKGQFKNTQELIDFINEFIQPAIGLTREYQTLQAIANCTRKSLLPENDKWKDAQKLEMRIRELEQMGVS